MSTPGGGIPGVGENVAGDSGSEVATQAPDNETTTSTTFLATGLDNMAARASVLALFIIVGFVGNCVLVATIAQSHRLKVFKLNLFILSCAIVNLINCIVNMPLILGNTITEQWDYGDFVCRFNAFTIQLASIAMLLGLMLMSLDRFLAVRYADVEAYTAVMTPVRANFLIVYSWLHAFGFSIPLIFGIIPVKAFPARYLCSVDSGAPILYLALRSIFSYLIPLIVILGFFIYIIKTSIQERMRRSLHRNSYTEGENEPQLQTEINTAKFVGVVMALWCLCEGPYLLLTAIEQYKNSSIIQNSGIEINFEYPWEVDLSFTWLKLSYAIVLPIVTFFWRKEVWQKFKNCVLCRKSNLVVDASPKRKTRKKDPPKRLAIPEPNNKVEMNTNGSFTVPVLFATPEGLHVQTFSKKDADLLDNETDLEKGLDTTFTDTSVVATKCDVYGSQNFLDLDEGDTSDYDSEIDPFSGSNPISVHTKGSFDKIPVEKDTVIEVKEPDAGDKEEIRLDDSGLAFTINSKEREKDKTKKKKKEKEKEKEIETQEDIDQGIIIDDRNDQDSGRGSYGENSLRKKRRQKQLGTEDNNSPNKEGQDQLPKTVDDPQSNTQPETNNSEVPTKRKKRKKKNKVVETDTTGQDPAEETERKPIPAMRRPAPPRLNPIQNRDEYLDKISSAGDGPELAFQRHHPLPERPLPELPDREKRTQRQLSEQPKSNLETGPKAFTRSNSESCVASNVSETPTPAPRKTRPRSLVVEEDEGSQDGSIRPMRRKERKRTTSQSTTDSQTMLLQSSNTSTDLSDLQELNKVITKKEGYPNQLPKLTKKTKKKAPDVKKSESKQDLLDPPRL